MTARLVCLSLVLLLAACSTCPPCVPEHEVVELAVPVYSCPAPPRLPELVLPAWPEPPADPTAERIKAWYVEMVSTMMIRFDLLNERVEALDRMLEAYRGNQPPP